MSRGVFSSHNKVGEIMSFQTNHNGSGFNPSVGLTPFLNLEHRVSWDFGDSGDTAYYAGNNSPSKTYPDGSLKTVRIRTNLLSEISSFTAINESLVGNLDLSRISLGNEGGGSSTTFSVNNNPSLTGITHTATTKPIVSYEAYNNDLTGELILPFTKFLEKRYIFGLPVLSTGRFLVYDNPNLTKITHTRPVTSSVSEYYYFFNNDITGNHDVSMFVDLGTSFIGRDNTNMTGVTHTASTRVMLTYDLSACNITGNHDVSMFSGLGGNFAIDDNPNLTSISHVYSPNLFSDYDAFSCNLTGNHDVSMFPRLGGNFRINSNSGLTSTTHTASTEVFTTYTISDCNLTGNHDLSMFPGLGGIFRMADNLNLTGITHTVSTQTFTQYYVNRCNITGNHDLSMLSGLGGLFLMQINPNLTGITHTASTQTFTQYYVDNSNLTGNHDVSMFPNMGGSFTLTLNSLLTGITNPLSTKTFNDYWVSNCDLNYVNFLPLSGATMGDIRLEENNMSVTDVNHILVDFDNMSTNLNPSGWSGVTLDISGTNAAPDSSSGGFDGIAALSSLTGGTNNWTITTS
jgi:hypothetical protein